MKKLSKNVLLPALLSLGLFGNLQNLYSQTSLHDSLRHILTRVEENTKDGVLMEAIRDLKKAFTSHTIGDSLSKKLLFADSLIVKSSKLDKPVALAFAKTLVQLFKLLGLLIEERK